VRRVFDYDHEGDDDEGEEGKVGGRFIPK